MIVNGATLMVSSPIEEMIPHKVKANGLTHGLGEAGYDIRIAEDIIFERTKFRTKKGKVKKKMGVAVNGEIFRRGRFTLASAMEVFDMPTDLVAVVHDKSSWARRGLSVFNTVIEPGWAGFLTLELVYHGRKRLHIPAGTGIAQVLFHTLEVEAKYEGRYQNQPAGAVEAKLA